ncbi:MAG: septum formation initiator family protein [Clostridia bacterium]|nr:septum formation initiator family protein [Clostridia bacterium]
MSKKIFIVLFCIIISIYAIITLVNQQITLNRYNEDQAKLTEQIKEAKIYKEELVSKKENVNSEEFIEQTAREKLDMYLPTEKVYIDAGL